MIDQYEYKQKIKDILIAISAIGFLICPIYEIVILGLIVYFDIKKLHANVGLGVVAGGVIIKILNSGLLNETNRGFILNWLFCPSPIQLLMMFASCLLVLNFFSFMKSNYRDWMLDDEIKREKKAVPFGEYDFEDRNHVLCVGTTGSGKTTYLKKVVEHQIKKDSAVVIISGKSSYGDPHSLLLETQKYCDKYNKPLLVVRLMEPELSDGYNPLRHLSAETVADALCTVSVFSEEHYKVHTKTWILKIAELIRYMGVSMSLQNILLLYDFDVFEKQANKALKEGKITDEQYDRLLKDAEKNADIAADSKERFKQYLETETVRDILVGKKLKSFKEVLNEKGVLFLDLHGPSYSDLTRDLATFACCDIAEALNQDMNPDYRKVIIMDELSFTFNERLSALYATARSTGAQIISATQSLADLNDVSETLCEKLIENSNAYAIFRQNSALDSEACAKILGTESKAKITQKSDGNRYDPSGTTQITREFKVHPDWIKELPKLQMFYSNKDTGKLVRVKWNYDDKEPDVFEGLGINLNNFGNNL